VLVLILVVVLVVVLIVVLELVLVDARAGADGAGKRMSRQGRKRQDS
jgi:uncharacterized membrane protein